MEHSVVQQLPDGGLRYSIEEADWHGLEHLRPQIDLINNALNEASHCWQRASAECTTDNEFTTLIEQARDEWRDFPVPDDNTDDLYDNVILAIRAEEQAKEALRSIRVVIEGAGLLPWNFLQDKIFDFDPVEANKVLGAVD